MGGGGRGRAIFRHRLWQLLLGVGLISSFLGILVDACIGLGRDWRHALLSATGSPVWRLVFWVAWSVIATCLAVRLSRSSAEAQGSGIPQMKVILAGGISTERAESYLSVRCLAVKMLGLVLGKAGGLSIGKEGPWVHISAALAHILVRCSAFAHLGVEKDHWREIISAGFAAGTAANFGAPIGGVLFSLEEASTHWSHDTTWRSLLCSTLAILTLSLCRAVGAGAGAGPGPGRAGFLSLTAPGLISFGSSDGAPPARFYAWELLAFAALAACAGFVAAFLTRAAKALSPRRPKTGAWRVAEATATAFVVVTVAFFAATFLGVCREMPGGDANANDASSTGGGGAGSEIWTPAVAVALRCPPGAFNDLGALLLGVTRGG